MSSKKCSKCGVEKELEGFHRQRSKKNGRASWCRECEKLNNVARRATVAHWKKANPEKVAAQVRRRAQRRATPCRRCGAPSSELASICQQCHPGSTNWKTLSRDVEWASSEAGLYLVWVEMVDGMALKVGISKGPTRPERLGTVGRWWPMPSRAGAFWAEQEILNAHRVPVRPKEDFVGQYTTELVDPEAVEEIVWWIEDQDPEWISNMADLHMAAARRMEQS